MSNGRHHFNTPALQVCSWYDSVVNEAFLLAKLMRENGESARSRENQFVVIAPTTHCAFDSVSDHTVVGKRELGDAQFDYYNLYLRWYDHWLKGGEKPQVGAQSTNLRDGAQSMAIGKRMAARANAVHQILPPQRRSRQ